MRRPFPDKLPIQFRELSAERKVDSENRTVEFSFSSNKPYERWYGLEILSHAKGAINTERLDAGAVPLLLNHDWDTQIGTVLSYSVENGKASAVVKFSQSAIGQEVYQDVLDGIRKNVSVGYTVDEMDDMPREMSKVRGMLGIPDEESDPDYDLDDEEEERFVVTRWTVFEISMVSVPADYTVGVGRDASSLAKRSGIYAQSFEFNNRTEPKNTEPNMSKPTEPNPDPANNGGTRTAEPPVVDVKVIQEKAREDARKEEMDRVREISAIGARFGKSKEAEDFITSGRSVQEFQSELLKDSSFNSQPVSTPGNDPSTIGMSTREVKRFSLVKAIREAAGVTLDGTQLDASRRGLTGLEKEACEATAQRLKKSPNGFFLPNEIMQSGLSTARELERMGRRDLTATNVTAGSAGNAGLTVADLLLTPMIEILRRALIVDKLGATVLSGLTGNVYFPRQTAGGQAYWLPETGAVTQSNITFDQVPLTPHRIAAQMKFSKQLIIQSSIDIEALVRFEIAYRMAAEIDRTALQGDATQTPSTGSPYGIFPRSLPTGTSGGYPAAGILGTVTPLVLPSPITYATMASALAALMAANVPLRNIGWVGSPTIWEELITTPRFSNSTSLGSIAILTDDGTVMGYPFYPTNQLSVEADGVTVSDASASIILGAWAELLIGVWDGFDLVVDPYTAAGTGEILITAQQFCDVNVRHGASFVVISPATLP
jgi:HK97 family phage major capsid protein